jgi:hypothetical protein
MALSNGLAAVCLLTFQAGLRSVQSVTICSFCGIKQSATLLPTDSEDRSGSLPRSGLAESKQIRQELLSTAIFIHISIAMPVSVAARSKRSVCDRSPAEIVGWNPTGDLEVCLL